MITATRYHDFSAGHRVAGHENKCAHLHGHNYRVHFTCCGTLDKLGRVLDFSAINDRLCLWLEEHWDHKFLVWEQDMQFKQVSEALLGECAVESLDMFHGSLVWVPFNPTAENMAGYLLRVIGPRRLAGTGVRLVEVKVEETRKCSASADFREVYGT